MPTRGRPFSCIGAALFLIASSSCEGTYRYFESSDAAAAASEPSDSRKGDAQDNSDTKDGGPECDSSACDVSAHSPEDAGISRVCDASPGAAPSEYACIECITNGDCTEPTASRCENNRCVACRDDFDQVD
jgi:hypothetical protein